MQPGLAWLPVDASGGKFGQADAPRKVGSVEEVKHSLSEGPWVLAAVAAWRLD